MASSMDIGDSSSHVDMITLCRKMYPNYGLDHVNIVEATDAINSAWYESTRNYDGRVIVGRKIQPLFVRKELKGEVKDLGKLLDRIGIRSHIIAPEKYPGRLKVFSMNLGIVERIVALMWEGYVTISTVVGLVGRMYELRLKRKLERIRKYRRSELSDERKVSNIRILDKFL